MAVQLVENIAQQQAMVEQSARREERARIEQEMVSARYIQQSLLPEEVPSIPGWQIQPFYRPAQQVGGDMYDFLPLPDDRIGIVIGDANGKGMPAALIMATTCAMLRAAGMPLGLMPDQCYSEQEVSIGAGDNTLFYSDGLVEAHASDRAMFGNPRLKCLLQEHSREEGLIEFLLNELQEFTGEGWELEDDVTLVLLRKIF
jgi:serine phosphatase RsbU (regulator of sigma subunit)